MAKTEFDDFNIPIDGYAAFDAQSLKNLIITRLNANNIFTDQNYEGSNLSSIIDIIGYSYHVLLFYLNRTGSESTFTTAELYENINKIVNLIGYSPVGYQTPTLSFNAAAESTLPAGTYTIPRYAYFTVNGTYYSFNTNVTFVKTLADQYENLSDFSNSNLLYQGIYREYPIYTATGEPFEILTLTNVNLQGGNPTIDHFNIDVYVKDNTVVNPKWELYSTTPSVFLERSDSKVYERRLNENLRYEIKFGNNITGKQLNPGDQVAVYYLQSAGKAGEIGPGVLDGNKLFFYTTPQYSGVQADTIPINVNLLTQQQAGRLSFTNNNPSTVFVDVESADSIRINAKNSFKSQFRLITADDFTNYVLKNYSNILASAATVNNHNYINGHLKYYFDLGVTKPNYESRVLLNQVNFSSASNANNVYIYAVPKLELTTSLATRANYLNTAQKQLIINDLEQVKLTTSDIVINDPVYVAFDLGVTVSNQDLVTAISDRTTLNITRDITSKVNPNSIAEQVAAVFTKYFSTLNDNLGLLVNISDITNSILTIPGVVSISTSTKGNDGNTYTVPGISFVFYNPVYPFNDIEIATQNIQLPYFKFPYLNNASTFVDRIVVTAK
jgi:hypothetical protein